MTSDIKLRGFERFPNVGKFYNYDIQRVPSDFNVLK
tara:strand:- start:492 stop:599 length:108 start_codon:yes stop_codon:yes gene_type:complete